MDRVAPRRRCVQTMMGKTREQEKRAGRHQTCLLMEHFHTPPRPPSCQRNTSSSYLLCSLFQLCYLICLFLAAIRDTVSPNGLVPHMSSIYQRSRSDRVRIDSQLMRPASRPFSHCFSHPMFPCSNDLLLCTVLGTQLQTVALRPSSSAAIVSRPTIPQTSVHSSGTWRASHSRDVLCLYIHCV